MQSLNLWSPNCGPWYPRVSSQQFRQAPHFPGKHGNAQLLNTVKQSCEVIHRLNSNELQYTEHIPFLAVLAYLCETEFLAAADKIQARCKNRWGKINVEQEVKVVVSNMIPRWQCLTGNAYFTANHGDLRLK